MGVALTPHDAAKTILFLSCEDSSGITGTALIIDAGYLTAAEWDTHGQTAFTAGTDRVGTRSRHSRRAVRVRPQSATP
jgi:hypothetical protein